MEYPEAFDQLMFGLRLATTPVYHYYAKANTADHKVTATGWDIMRGSTFDNDKPRAHRSPTTEKYAGTRLGRQELYAEVLTEQEGALWSPIKIENQRIDISEVPDSSESW